MKSFSPSKQRKAGVVLQYVQMILNVVISLAFTPIMLRILGQNEYGIYNLASSTIGYLSIISLGLGSSYIRFYSLNKKNGDEKDVAKLNGLYFVVFLAMGIIALFAGGFLTANISWFYNSSYSSKEIGIARILMLLLTINLGISFPASVFVSYVTSQERFVFQKLINMGKTVLSPLVSLIFLYSGLGSIGMTIAITSVSILIDIINVCFCFGFLHMKMAFSNLPWNTLKPIFSFSIFIAINQIIDQINWQTDKIILGKMVNGSAVAIYAVGSSINTMYISISTAISSVFAPRIHQIVNSKKTENEINNELTNLFIKVGRIQFLLLSLVLSGFLIFGKFFIKIWAGADYTESYYVAALLICPATISLIQNIGIEIQRAKNKHQFRSIVYLIMAVLNVGISIFLCYLWGVIGVVLGTTLSLLLANGLIMNIYYHKKLGINVKKFWNSIFSIALFCFIPIAVGAKIIDIIGITSIFSFIILIAVYSIIFVSFVSLFATNKEEKQLVFGFFKKKK